MKIFGVKIDKYRKNNFIKECFTRLNSKSSEPFFIVTLNPEILLTAKTNLNYKKIINKANARIIDGFGIKLISWLKKKETSARITGANLAELLTKETSRLKLKTGIVFFEKGLSSQEQIKKSLADIENLKLIGVNKNNIKKTNLSSMNDCQLILVAIGHPYQEMLINNNLSKLVNTKIIIGIGGTLDYWTNKKTRAPKIIQTIGLEWMWRLILQPNRLARVFNASIKFPILAILNKE